MRHLTLAILATLATTALIAKECPPECSYKGQEVGTWYTLYMLAVTKGIIATPHSQAEPADEERKRYNKKESK